jgi:TonB family protein
MNDLLYYLLKVNLFIILLGISYELGFRKSKNFRFGRPFLVLGSIVAFIFPFLKTPQLHGSSILTLSEVIEPILISNPIIQESDFSWIYLVIITYSLGVLLSFIKLIASLYKLHVAKTNSTSKNSFYELKNSSAAFSFFNYIFIGSEIPEEEKKIVLVHEQIHKNRKHSFDNILLQLIQIILWYNPISYRISALTKEVHEFEVDSKMTINPERYIQIILSQHFENYNLSFIHQFNSNHLKNRIMRISSNSKNKLNKSAIILTLALFSFLIFSSQNVNSTTQTAQLNVTVEVDKKAEYPGGQAALFKFLGSEIKYPKVSKDKKSEGTVYASFTIGTDGVCKDFNIKRGVSEALDKAAIDALKKMPKWAPAEKEGKAVAMEMTIPVKFVLPPPPPPAPKAPDAPVAPTK